MAKTLLIPTSLSARIRYARELARLTQKEVAIGIGVKPPAVSQWESGTNPTTPTHDNLIRLADLLGVGLEWLASGTGPMKRAGGGFTVSVELPGGVRVAVSGPTGAAVHSVVSVLLLHVAPPEEAQ